MHQTRLIDVAMFSKVTLQKLFKVVNNESVHVVVALFFYLNYACLFADMCLLKWGGFV